MMRCSVKGRVPHVYDMPPLITSCAHVLRVLAGPYNVWLKVYGPNAICLEEITLA